MEDLSSFLNKNNIFAVVGVSRDKTKYGYKIYKTLKRRGYKVYPINPKTRKIDGDKCYYSLSELPEKIDVVSLVVPPPITEKIVVECKKLGIKKVWMQPGSESERAIEFCKKNGMVVVCNQCILLKKKRKI